MTFCLREPNCQLSGVFAKMIVRFAVKALLIRLLFAVVLLILMPLRVVFAFLDRSSGLASFHTVSRCSRGDANVNGQICWLPSSLSHSAFSQVTTCPVSLARLLSHQLRLRTGSIRPSRRSAAAHWPIRGARARRPQPAWRPTCRVRRNASSCRTAGSWAAMWPWRAGEW